MVKKGRHRKGGRTTPKGTRPHGYRPKHLDDDFTGDEPEPDLTGDVRRALADDHPLTFLALASSLVDAIDPRRVDPFDRSRATLGPDRSEVLGTFIDVDRPETTALLAAFAALGADEVERRRLERVVAARPHRLPAWLDGIAGAEACRAIEMTHVLRDGDSVLVGVRLPTGDELTAVVYIDHNLGTLVKDAFIVPDSIAATLRVIEDRKHDPDSSVAELPLADAKARIADAAATSAITYPPFETETWPACRPLVEWMVGLLPAGGRGYDRPEWSDADRDALTERFFASGFGAPLDDADHRGLVESILWFACAYGPGDPLRWSPVAVEIVLDDWIPRKVVADAEYLSKAPAVLRAFIRFCHAERDIPAHLTTETLAAVDTWEPEYQRAIRSPRPQGPAALLAAMGVLDPEGPWDMALDDEDDKPWDYRTAMLPFLERAVGGPEALADLDDTPLPDEPFDWAGIADDVRQRVAEVLELIDGCCDELLDVEHRTAARRVLRRIAANGPEVFRRRGRSDTAAAAICWSVCRANDTFDQRRGGLTQKALAEHFAIKGGSANLGYRAATLLDVGGFPRHPGVDFVLGAPDYLVSKRRRDILAKRARFDAGR
ncbi:hypothetical protein BH18ACT4_BH18ACT4_02360 [soil metagenome]